MDNDGIDTKFVEFDGEEYIKCIPKHLSSFTIGSFDEEIAQKKIEGNTMFKYEAIKVGLYILFLFGIFYIYRSLRKKRKKYIYQYEE